MQLSPKKIYSKFLNNKINRTHTIDLLISLINHSRFEKSRENAFSILNNIHPKNKSYYSLIENLYLSDPNLKIRLRALNTILNNYPELSLSLLNWSLNNENNFETLLIIIEHLMTIKQGKAQSILIQAVKKICKKLKLNKEES